MALAETITGKLQKGKSIMWSLITNDENQVVSIAMWEKKTIDMDLLIFKVAESSTLQYDEEIIPLGVGIGSTENLEMVTIGLPKNEEIYVMLSSYSGPVSKYQMNVQGTSSESLSTASLQFEGEIDVYEIGITRMGRIMEKAVDLIGRIKTN